MHPQVRRRAVGRCDDQPVVVARVEPGQCGHTRGLVDDLDQRHHDRNRAANLEQCGQRI